MQCNCPPRAEKNRPSGGAFEVASRGEAAGAASGRVSVEPPRTSARVSQWKSEAAALRAQADAMLLPFLKAREAATEGGGDGGGVGGGDGGGGDGMEDGPCSHLLYHRVVARVAAAAAAAAAVMSAR